MVLSLGHRKQAKNLTVASATASHMGTVLPRPRSAQSDGACWAARLAGHHGGPRGKHMPIPVELTAKWENDALPGNG